MVLARLRPCPSVFTYQTFTHISRKTSNASIMYKMIRAEYRQNSGAFSRKKKTNDEASVSIRVSFTGPLLVKCLPSVIYGISNPVRLTVKVAFITSGNGIFLR